MDYVVHINNGSEKAEPIILHLLPGEEMKLNLKVVNHGGPSNISLKASNNIANAVRTDKPEHFLTGEGTIPVLARMPDVNRLDGEILLTGGGGQSRVPITLIRDSDGPEDNGSEKYVELSDLEASDDETDEEAIEEINPEDEDPDKECSNDSEESEDTSRIKFSKDKDLERYRASRIRISQKDSSDSEYTVTDNGHTDGDTEYRAMDFEDSVGDKQSENSPTYGFAGSAEGNETSEAAEESDGESKLNILDLIGENSALLVVPMVILVVLIALLLMTFYYDSIPEFTGALASSMLIVTLIIYGAATLLKA